MLLLMQYGSPLGGLVIALVALAATRRSRVALSGVARWVTAAVLLIVLAARIAYGGWFRFPSWIPDFGLETYLVMQLGNFMVPLVLTAVALLVLFVPVSSAHPHGPAELAPRTLATFTSRPWAVLAVVATGVVLLVTVFAGLASSVDEEGRYVKYGVDASSTTSASTNIYGWWFSVPSLITIAVLVALTLTAIIFLTRPPLAVNRDRDIAVRKARVRNVLAVFTGGMLLHLGAVLMSLYGTSTLRLGFQAGPSGWVELGTSFAAIGPALLVASYVISGLGYATWWSVLLSTVRIPSRKSAPVVLT